MNSWDYIVIMTAIILAFAAASTSGAYHSGTEFIGGLIGLFVIWWILGAGLLYVIRWFRKRD